MHAIRCMIRSFEVSVAAVNAKFCRIRCFSLFVNKFLIHVEWESQYVTSSHHKSEVTFIMIRFNSTEPLYFMSVRDMRWNVRIKLSYRRSPVGHCLFVYCVLLHCIVLSDETMYDNCDLWIKIMHSPGDLKKTPNDYYNSNFVDTNKTQTHIFLVLFQEPDLKQCSYAHFILHFHFADTLCAQFSYCFIQAKCHFNDPCRVEVNFKYFISFPPENKFSIPASMRHENEILK